MSLKEILSEHIRTLRIKKNIKQSEPGKFGSFG